jgi:hypothetical protein
MRLARPATRSQRCCSSLLAGWWSLTPSLDIQATH